MSTFIGRKVRIINPYVSTFVRCNTDGMKGEIGTVIETECNELIVEFPNHGQKAVKIPTGSIHGEAEWYTEPDQSLHINKLKESGRKIAIHTVSQEEWDKVLEIMEGADVTWCNGDNAANPGQAKWEIYKGISCIALSGYSRGMTYSPIGHYQEEGYQILEASDFIAANTPPVQDIPVPDNRWYVRCIEKDSCYKELQYDKEYEIVSEKKTDYDHTYRIMIGDREMGGYYTNRFTPKYQKNQQALDRTQELKKQIQDIEESLKEPVYKVDDWVYVVKPCITSKNKTGDVLQISEFRNCCVDGIDGSNLKETYNCGLRGGSWEPVSSTNIRAATPEEIQKATTIKVGEYIVLVNNDSYISGWSYDGKSHTGAKRGDVVKVEGIAPTGGNATSEDPRYYGDNWNARACDIRRATKEEVEAIQVKTLTVGSKKTEVEVLKRKIQVYADSTWKEVKIADIDRVCGIMKGTKGFNGWEVVFKEVKVGCINDIQYSELKAIQDAYNKINSI